MEPYKKIESYTKMFFNFLGANFLKPKSFHQREKQSVLGPASKILIVNLSTDRDQALTCFLFLVLLQL